MTERVIWYQNPDNKPLDLEHDFIEGEGCISRKEIRGQALELVKKIKDSISDVGEDKLSEDDKEKVLVIINHFVDDQMEDAIRNYIRRHSKTATGDKNGRRDIGFESAVIKDASVVIRQIRKMLIEEISALLDSQQVAFIRKVIKEGTDDDGCTKLNFCAFADVKEGKRFVKHLSHLALYKDDPSAVDMPQRISALKKFSSISKSEIPPSVLPVSFDEKSFIMTSEAVNFKNLSEIKNEENNNLKLEDFLQVFSDIFKGCIFFEKNGLVLQDICLENIGVTKEGRGLLFDLDYLFPAGEKCHAFFSHLSSDGVKLFPPAYEGIEEKKGVVISTTTEMVYQLGASLKVLLKTVPPLSPDVSGVYADKYLEVLSFLDSLVEDMIKGEPDKVIDLKTAENRFEKIRENWKRFNELMQK